jgi:hypothetical protein
MFTRWRERFLHGSISVWFAVIHIADVATVVNLCIDSLKVQPALVSVVRLAVSGVLHRNAWRVGKGEFRGAVIYLDGLGA